MNNRYNLTNKRTSAIVLIITNLLLFAALAGCSNTKDGGPPVMQKKFPGVPAGKTASNPPPAKN